MVSFLTCASQGSVATRLRCGRFIMHLVLRLKVKKNENLSTFGKVVGTQL